MSNIFVPLKFGKETFHARSFDEQSFVMNYKLEPKGKVPNHLHKFMDEHFLVTKGEMTFKVDGKTIIKKVGEEIMVPKGITHSISNKGKEEVEMVVTYSPCSDTDKMFEIITTLNTTKPNSMVNLMKFFYVSPRLGHNEFSSPQPAFIGSILNGMVSIYGKLAGWNKLVVQFNHLKKT